MRSRQTTQSSHRPKFTLAGGGGGGLDTGEQSEPCPRLLPSRAVRPDEVSPRGQTRPKSKQGQGWLGSKKLHGFSPTHHPGFVCSNHHPATPALRYSTSRTTPPSGSAAAAAALTATAPVTTAAPRSTEPSQS